MVKAIPAPSLRELSSECETEGVSPDEWERLNIQSFRRGDENRPKPHGFASTRLNGKYPHTEPPKNHPPADEISSGRVIDVMGDVSRLPL